MTMTQRVLINGSVVPVVPCIQLDAQRFSYRGFRQMVPPDEVSYINASDVVSLTTEFCNAIESSHPNFMKWIRGEDLHDKLAGKSYVYCGGACIDFTEANEHNTRWFRNVKNLWTINLDGPTATVSGYSYVYPETFTSKMGRHPMQLRDKTTHLAQVRLPFSETPLTESHIRVYTGHDDVLLGDTTGFTFEGGGDNYYDGLKSGSRCDGQPQLTIAGAESIAAGGSDEYVVSLVNNMGRVITGQRDVYVYLDCNEGYIPRRKLLIDHVTGKAKFTATALGLNAGDTMTLEAGFKHYTAATKHSVTVG